MTRAEGSARLREVAAYRAAHRALRVGAVGSLALGGLTLAMALSGPRDPFLVWAGAVLLATGAWSFFAPRPIGIVLDGLTLVTAGGYNFSGLILAVLGESIPGADLWGAIGVLQFALGVHGFARLVQFGDAFRPPASGAELQDLDAIAADIWNAPLEESPDIVELVVGGFRAGAWRVCLEPDAAVIVSRCGADVRVCDVEAFDIEVYDDVADPRPVRIHAGTKVWRGSMSPGSLERIQEWKSFADVGADAPEEAAA